ncbi:MAG: hypothetical protein U1G07_24750 [Verrucomicrobiota bacterium]
MDNRAYALAGYASYAIIEKFKANARVDYLNADAGTFYGFTAGTPGGGGTGEDLASISTSGAGFNYNSAAHEKLLATTLTSTIPLGITSSPGQSCAGIIV